ncbi:MAG: hypothetical protein SFY69_02435 [Planctomycetota bacterium]|nr:hypothetical protein [Planctomycetota bacterium]
MNRLTVAIASWVLLGLEIGLRVTGVGPGLVFILAMFIAMCAHPRHASWAALLLGLLIDLTSPLALTSPGPPAILVGPHAVAYLLGAHLVLALRGVMIRRNPLTLGFLSLGAGLVAQTALLAFYWFRALIDPVAFTPSGEMLARLGWALVTGAAAVPLAFVLIPLAEIMGLPSQTQRRFGRRE